MEIQNYSGIAPVTVQSGKKRLVRWLGPAPNSSVKAFNALEAHGLDLCPDHGLHGFNRYVSRAVLARNIQQLGVALRNKHLAELARKEKLKLAA